MNCLQGFIGLIGCNTEAPDSGLLINSLPGISLESMDKIADADQITYLGVWKDVETRSLKRLETDLTNKFAARYRLTNPHRSLTLGQKINVNNTYPSVDKLRGFITDLSYANRFVDSVFKRIFVQEISLYAPTVVTAMDVFVYDLYTGKKLDTITSDLTIGWNTLRVNKYYDSRQLFIGYDANEMDAVELSVQDLYLWNADNGWNQWYVTDRINGAEIDKNLNSLTKGFNTYGLSAIYAVNCTYDALVCNNKNLFATSLWYLLGIEFMTERIFSPRKNIFTTIDRDRAKENKEYFSEMYDKELQKAIDSIQIDLSDACIECNKQVTNRTVMP